MTKLELLRKYENMAQHNLFCYSRNLGMTEPKEGFEKQWERTNEECKLLDEMIKEVAHEVPVQGQLILKDVRLSDLLSKWKEVNCVPLAEAERVFNTFILKEKRELERFRVNRHRQSM